MGACAVFFLSFFPFSSFACLQGYRPGCVENRHAVLELVANVCVVEMTPTVRETSSRNGGLFFQLKLYANRSREWKNI